MRALLVGIVFLVLGCAAAQPMSIAAQAPDGMALSTPFAPRPTWVVGDAWTFKGRDYSYQVVVKGETTFEGQPAYEVWSGRYVRYFTKDFGFIAQAVDGKVTRRIVPPTDREWPLIVGKTWSWSGTWTDTERTMSSYTYRDTWTVLAFEEVTVPAGTFKVFRARRQVDNSSAYDEIWYCPEVKYVVKARGSSAAGTYDEELVTYRVQ